MSLFLQAVERYLGNFNDWPADILELLFIHYPTPSQMQKLLAFFYGNGAPCPFASQLFHACNTHSTAADNQIIYDTYEEWDKNQMGKHISKYYNLRSRKYVYLNGRQENQQERVPNLTEPPPLGIHNTGFPFLINLQLVRLRHTNVFYP
jgi:hypothetical protein